jgi:hypothetical protein
MNKANSIIMVYPESFLQLCLNAEGLPGIYIQEHRRPYRYFDEMGKAKPRGITAIGGWMKRQFLAAGMGIFSQEHCSIAVASLGHTIVFDCELHLLSEDTIPRIHAGPTKGNIRAHLVQRQPTPIPQFAYRIYCNIFSRFSDVVLIFISDFGGIGPVVDFLCYWMHCAMATGMPNCSRVLLIHNGRPPVEGGTYLSIIEAFARSAQAADPTTGYSLAAIKKIANSCFRITDLSLQCDIFQSVRMELDGAFSYRCSTMLDFKAPHYKALLEAAICEYMEDPSRRFDFISASRSGFPAPESFGQRIIDFLTLMGASERNIEALASALVLDAYPLHMHSMI